MAKGILCSAQSSRHLRIWPGKQSRRVGYGQDGRGGISDGNHSRADVLIRGTKQDLTKW